LVRSIRFYRFDMKRRRLKPWDAEEECKNHFQNSGTGTADQ
jgi:hypothetical protein